MNASPVLDMVTATARAHPEAAAIVQGERSLSYRELAAAVPRFARTLAGAGAAPGAHVLLVLDNRPEFAIAYFATAAAGCTVEAIDPDQPERALRRRLADSRPAVVVTTAGHPVTALTGLPVVAVDGPPARPGAPGAGHPPAPGGGAWVRALSSGSTGEPKRVLRDQSHQVAEADNITTTAGITAADALLCPVPLFHALGQFCCLLAAVRSGATLVLTDRGGGMSSVDAVVRALARHRVTLLITVPQLADALADLPAGTRADLGAVRLCLSGSNFLDPAVAQRFEDRFGLPLRQTYGSTEAGSVCWDVGPQPSPGTVGTPLKGARVTVVDERGAALPPGATGEIVVSGPAVVNDPGSDHHRTGDLGRWDAHGRLTVTGRSRVLIDTGGHKVNPVEVERVLTAHPLIADAAVAGVPLPGRGALLVAAVQPRAGAPLESAPVLAHCARHLPAHAVPRRIRLVTQIPRTALGKVRRAALAAQLAPAGHQVAAGTRERLAALPRDQRRAEVGELLRRWVAEVAGGDGAAVDLDAPASGAGVDSLAALRLRMAVHEGLGVRAPLPSLLGPRPLAELADELADRLDAPADEDGPVPRGPAQGRFPLAPNQLSLWHAAHLDLGGSAYVVAVAARLTGGCDTGALRRAWTTLADRHPVLRTSFPEEDGNPVQRVAATARVDFAVVPVPPSWDRTHREELVREAFAPFDITARPPLRIRLYTGAPEGPVMVVSQHHLITDHWSTLILLRELAVLYAAESAGGEAYLPAPAHGYADFAVWSLARAGTPLGAEHLAHWVRRLTPPPPPAELATDRPRPVVRGQRGSTLRVELAPSRVAAVHACARAAGTTPFAVLLTVFHVLLHASTGRADSAVGVNVANRERPEFADVLGYFANPVVHRVRLRPEQSFAGLLRLVAGELVAGLEHGGVTFDRLLGPVGVVRDRGRAPLVEVGFGQNTAHDPALGPLGALLSADRDGVRVPLGPLSLETVALRRTGAVYDLAGAVFEEDGTIAVVWEYDTDLFTRATVARWAARFDVLVDTLLAAPGAALGSLSALAARGDGPVGARTAEGLADRVRRHARTNPLAAAVVDGADSRCYGEVDRAADAVAAALAARSGLGPGAVVAVVAERAADLAAACLGVLRAGLLCGPVTARGGGVAAEVSALGAAALVDLAGGTRAPGTPVVRIGGASGPGALPPVVPVVPETPALVVGTSGTTGDPRWMVLSHRALADAVRAEERGEVLIARGPAGRLAVDVLTTLAAGGTAVPLAPADRLEELARGRAVASAALTPAELARLVGRLDEGGGAPSVGTLVISGEPLDADLVRRWRSHAPRGRLVQVYGGAEWGLALAGEELTNTTDTTDTADAGDIADAGGAGPAAGIVPVGRAGADPLLCVLDPWGRACPEGVPGEIGVGARGAPRPLTAVREERGDCVVAHPLVPDATVRRTGDAGLFLPGGRLVVLGRVAQVRSEDGYHPDPLRVEGVLRAHRGVRAATVSPGEAVVESDGSVSADELLEWVRQRVPAHLVPGRVRSARVPATPDGKASRRPAPAAPGPGAPRPAEEMNAVEAALADVWREVLGAGDIGLDDDYYTLGGDSVQALRIATKAAEKGLQVTRRHLFTHPTIRSLARVTTSTAGAATVSRSFARRRAIPLTPVQRWFFALSLPDPGHWNQSVALRVPGALSSPALLSAVRAVAAHHGVLRHRFRVRDTGWEQVSDPTAETVAVEEVTAAGDTAVPAAIDRARRGVDLAAGPLLRATLIEGGTRGRLLVLTAHHLVVDVLSWGVLLDDLRAVCARPATDPVRLPPVPLGYDVWARALRTYADGLADGAGDALGRDAPGESAGPPPTTYEGDTRVVERALDAARTGVLLRGVRRRGARPADAVLAAVGRAAAAALGCRAVRVVMELHGREDVADGMDPARTVGWFTALDPVRVDAAPDAAPGTVLSRVQAALSPSGLAYGLTRYGPTDGTDGTDGSRSPAADRSWVSVNYLGALGSVFTGAAPDGADALVPVPLPDRGDRGPGNPRPFHWEFSAYTHDGELVLRLAHAQDEDQARRLVDTAWDYLRALAAELELTESEESR
ncbi:condensation domain-containing protein [Streptomyces sp. NPDC057638]|uniref:condensation domain-containing protein n=1 Tax=Streptomyces sp. NPDC057638 TaxID=3346190 RepID=UPI003674784F